MGGWLYLSKKEARTLSPSNRTALKERKWLNPAYTFSWNCWTSTSLADKKWNTITEQSLTCFVSSFLLPGTCFSYSFPCDRIKAVISPCCRWDIQVPGWIFISTLQHKDQQSWPEEPKTLVVQGPSSLQSHTELFRMMLNIFRCHCDLQEWATVAIQWWNW